MIIFNKLITIILMAVFFNTAWADNRNYVNDAIYCISSRPGEAGPFGYPTTYIRNNCSESIDIRWCVGCNENARLIDSAIHDLSAGEEYRTIRTPQMGNGRYNIWACFSTDNTDHGTSRCYR